MPSMARRCCSRAAYVFSQVVRSAFMLWATHGHDQLNFNNFRRIISWHLVSGVFWIAGGLCHGPTRVILWVIALGIECVGPYAGFHVPGLGRSGTAGLARGWRAHGRAQRAVRHHRAGRIDSRNRRDGRRSAGDRRHICAFLIAFVGSVAMWWIYFNIGAERGSHQIAHSEDPGRIARGVYTYFHIPIVAGIVVCAVADEMTIKHPVATWNWAQR